MKDRIRNLNSYQKFILIAATVMFAAFTIGYYLTTSRVGFEFKGNILVPNQQENAVVYSGRAYGQNIDITVADGKTVTFAYEEKTYGPYTVRDDATAIPEDHRNRSSVKGVEIALGEEIFFRGGFMETGAEDFDMLIFSEDATVDNLQISFVGSDGVEYDTDGNPIDRMAPTAENIIKLTHNPKMVHKGNWLGWFAGTLLLVLTAVEVLFADEIFRWNMKWLIRNADRAQPSDWEMLSRYIGWTVLPLMALWVYFMALTV